MKKKTDQEFLKKLCSHGLTKREADIVMSEYVEADRVGQHSHGSFALPKLLERLKDRGGPIKVIKSNGPIVYLDGRRELGQLAAEKTISLLIPKVKHYGVGFAGLRNILPFSRPGTYAKRLAERGFIGIVMIDGGTPMVTHPDSPQPIIGTNPIAFGMPTSRGPLVIDMATSQRAWLEVRLALSKGIKLPPKTYKDKLGNFTTDPKQAFSAVPFGGYKGFALGMLVEILCGSLLNMEMSKHKKAVNNVAKSRSTVFIAIDPAQFVSLNKFKREVTRFLREIKSSKQNKGVGQIRVPGESGLRLK